MSQNIQHYQTSFVVRSGNQSASNMLYQAQFLVGEWIKNIEYKRFIKSRRDVSSSFLINGDFVRRASYASRNSWCKTNYCLSEGSCAWVVEYTHRDSEHRNVFWVSEIGFRCFDNDNSIVVNVRISYKIPSELVLTGMPYSPRSSVPKVVEGLLETFEGCRFYSGEQDVTTGIKDANLLDDVETAKKVLRYIDSEERKLAVVLLGGESPAVKREANLLQRNLFGKALVYVVSFKLDIRKALGGLRLGFDECLFVPTFRVRERSAEHNLRYQVSNFKDAEDKHGLILKAWMAVHSINEQGAVVTLSDISTMVRREQLQKLEKELKKSFSVEQYESVVGQLHEISGLFEISEAVNKELVTEKKELQGRNDVLELQKMQLEDDKKAMEEQHKSELAGQGEMYRGMLRKRSEIRDVPRDLPLTVGALKIWAVSFENLIIADKAWEGMRHRNREEQVKTAWDMLWCLNYPVHQFYNGNITAVPSEYIVNNTGYEFSSNESDTTKNRKEWASQRTAVIDRRSIECYKHLKDGVGAGTAMRVYFEYDAETAKIVVAHIGEHLTTKATART